MTTTRDAPARNAHRDGGQPAGGGRVTRHLVADIQDQVVRGELADGTFLGRERELMDAYGVSRASLREALRMLEADGFVQVRRGPGGGVFARLPGHSSLAATLAPHLRMRGAQESDIVDAARVLAGWRSGSPHPANPALDVLADVLAELVGTGLGSHELGHDELGNDELGVTGWEAPSGARRPGRPVPSTRAIRSRPDPVAAGSGRFGPMAAGAGRFSPGAVGPGA